MPAFLPRCKWMVRPLGTALLCATLGACVSVAIPKLPTGDLPAHWRNAPQLGPKPDLTGWWKHFHDPELNALVEQALHDDLNVQQAVLKLRAARALEEASSSTFKPKLAFNTIEQPNAENTASYFQAGFDASWEFGLFGRSGAHRHLAAADTGKAEAELQSARVSLVAEVVREYLQLRAAQRSEALLTDAAHAAQKKLALMQVRERLQLASRLQVDEARAAAAKASGALADPRIAIVRYAQALAVLLGKSEPEAAWLTPRPEPILTAGNVTSVPANLLRTRPEIRYAEAEVLEAAGELGIAKANLYPRLALGSSLTFAALVKGHERLGDINNSFAIGPIINIPLFDWGERRAVRNARGDQLQAALLGYRQAVLQGAAEVETDLAALHASRQRLESAKAAAAASQDGLSLTRKLRGLGQADALQQSDAELASVGADLERGQDRLAHALAYVRLYKALGGAPLPKDDAATRGGSAPGGASLPEVGAATRGGSTPLPSGEGARRAGEGTPRSMARQLESEPSPAPLSRGQSGADAENEP